MMGVRRRCAFCPSKNVSSLLDSTIETMPYGVDNGLPPSSEKLPLANAQAMLPLIASTPMNDMTFATRMVSSSRVYSCAWVDHLLRGSHGMNALVLSMYSL